MAVKKSGKKKGGGIVSDKVGSYEKHPFFVKKKAAATAFLKKVGLPVSMLSKVSKG